MPLVFHIALLAALLAITGSSSGATPLAVPVDGEPFPGQLSAVNVQWQLTFAAAAGPRAIAAAELVQWGTFRETSRAPILVLADGSLLVADVLGADKETLTADSELFGTVKLPLERLAGIVFQPPATQQQRDLMLDRIAALQRPAAGDADRLVLENGDEVAGLLEAIENDTAKFRAAVGQLKIETQRIAAIFFNPSLVRKPEREPLQAWTGFADGSRLLATRLLTDDSALRITTATGQTWTTAPKNMVAIEPLGGRITYLSDLKADGYRQIPYLDLSWPYRTDRNVTGGLLRSGGRLYLKGLGMHSAARLTYTLQGPYKRFQAELGIDDSTAGGGSVRFRVFIDGHETFSSDIVRGGMTPVPLSLDLSGAKRLDLIVDYADRGDVLDHADWLRARLVK
jgi:hypothetical protein